MHRDGAGQGSGDPDSPASNITTHEGHEIRANPGIFWRGERGLAWGRQAVIDNVQWHHLHALHAATGRLIIIAALSRSAMLTFYLKNNPAVIRSETTEVYWGRHWIQTTITFCLVDVLLGPLSATATGRFLSQPLVYETVFHRKSLAPPSLSIFCSHLKSHLFSFSYPSLWLFFHLYSARAVTRHLGHCNPFYI